MPPVFCASAMTCKVMVVLPEDSGPNTSTTRPRGNPPTPKAASNEIAPVEITEMGTIASFYTNSMIDPCPNTYSFCKPPTPSALPGHPPWECGSFEIAEINVETNLAGLYIQS